MHADHPAKGVPFARRSTNIDAAVTAADRIARGNDVLESLASLGVERIDLAEDQLTVAMSQTGLLVKLGIDDVPTSDERIYLSSPVCRVRRGHELRLIVTSKHDAPAPKRDDKLAELLGEALAARKLVLGEAGLSLNQIALKHKRCRTRLARLVRLSWLSPELTRAIVRGSISIDLSASQLLAADLPPAWGEQRIAVTRA